MTIDTSPSGSVLLRRTDARFALSSRGRRPACRGRPRTDSARSSESLHLCAELGHLQRGTASPSSRTNPTEVAPVSWTPILFWRRSVRDAEDEAAVRGGVPAADGRPGSCGANARGPGSGVRAVVPRRCGPGWPRPTAMPELAATGCARRSVSFAGYAGRTGGCASHHHHLFAAPAVSGLVEHDASFSRESQRGGIAAGRHGVPEDNSLSTAPWQLLHSSLRDHSVQDACDHLTELLAIQEAAPWPQSPGW